VIGLRRCLSAYWQQRELCHRLALISVGVLLVLALPLAGWIAPAPAPGHRGQWAWLGLAASPLMIAPAGCILDQPVASLFALALPGRRWSCVIGLLCATNSGARLRDTVQVYGRQGRKMLGCAVRAALALA